MRKRASEWGGRLADRHDTIPRYEGRLAVEGEGEKGKTKRCVDNKRQEDDLRSFVKPLRSEDGVCAYKKRERETVNLLGTIKAIGLN